MKMAVTLIALGLTAGSAQASSFGEFKTLYDTCQRQVRTQQGYADMQSGFKKHLKDLLNAADILRCVSDGGPQDNPR
jgi:hypothetical protein